MTKSSTSWVSRIFNGADMERRITELEAELGVPAESPAAESDPWDSTASIFDAPDGR